MELPVLVRFGVLRFEARGDGSERRLGLGERDARRQAAAHVQPAPMAPLEKLVITRTNLPMPRERYPQVGIEAEHLGSAKARRRDAYHGERVTVQAHDAAHDVVTAEKTSPPKFVAQHDDGLLDVRAFEEPPRCGRNAKALEVVFGDQLAPDELGLARSVQAHGRAVEPDEVGEDLLLLTNIEIVLVAEIAREPIGRPHRIDSDELFGCVDGHRLQEHGVDEAEDRCVGADAERERDNDDESESRASYERPCCIAKVFEP